MLARETAIEQHKWYSSALVSLKKHVDKKKQKEKWCLSLIFYFFPLTKNSKRKYDLVKCFNKETVMVCVIMWSF